MGAKARLGCLLGTCWARCSGHVLTRRRTWGRLRTQWSDYVSWLAWERLCVAKDTLVAVAGLDGGLGSSI